MLINLWPKATIKWLKDVFESPSALLPEERGLRCIEEVLELAQCDGITAEQAHALVEQVYAKPVGEPLQELGGVLVTLGAWCAVTDRNPSLAFQAEFNRVHAPEVMEKIRTKHRQKAVVSAGMREHYAEG